MYLLLSAILSINTNMTNTEYLRKIIQLTEDDASVDDLQSDIIQQVKTTTEFSVLDRISQLLSSGSFKEKIENAFSNTLEGANVGDTTKVTNDMIDTVSHLQGSTQEKMAFLDSIEKGKAVNTSALLNSASTFSDIFPTKFAEEFFITLANYGRGNKLKGPGEFALAIMSPEITLAKKGDIEVNNENVEVKSAVNKSGGRMGEVGDAARKEEILAKVAKVGNKHIQEDDQESLELLDTLFLDKKSLAIRQAVQNAHTLFPNNNTAIKELIAEVIALTFGSSVGNAVGDSALKDPSGSVAELTYMKENFNWYKDKDGFDSILAIWFGGRKTYSFGTGNELTNLRSAGLFTGAGISFIPSKENEIFAQLNFGGKAAQNNEKISTAQTSKNNTSPNNPNSNPDNPQQNQQPKPKTPKNEFGRKKR